MSKLIASRRGFLFGAAAAIGAISGAKTLKAIPLFTARPDISKRTVYNFTVLPHPDDLFLPRDLMRPIPVRFDTFGEVNFAQVENGPYPTTYIPTTNAPATRAAECAHASVADGGWDWRQGLDGFSISRASTATDLNDPSKLIPPNTPRYSSKGLGLLVEEARTNYLLHSRNMAWKQIIDLPPGDYSLSWYGNGHIAVSGDGLVCGLARSSKGVYFDRYLTNAEIKALTE